MLYACVVLIMLEVYSDGCESNGLPLEPADTLQPEDLVRVVGQGLVL